MFFFIYKNKCVVLFNTTLTYLFKEKNKTLEVKCWNYFYNIYGIYLLVFINLIIKNKIQII